jgi:hypothetical protein
LIKTNTLFILGAGASKPFGYPTGIGLREKILGSSPDKNIIEALNRDGDAKEPFRQEIKIFRESFLGSSDYSIDSFIEHRPEFMDIGKIHIANYLIPIEDDKNLRNVKNNWYMYLFNRMIVAFEEFGNNHASFITFNYDRSLEQFLFKAIGEKFGKGDPECIEMMKNFQIVHLYGQLDPLPWQEENGKEYLPSIDIRRLRAAPRNIKLIKDERDIEKSEEFQIAYKLIEQAERIYFLGFSFDETNLNRLHLHSVIDTKQIFATAYGIEPSKLEWIDKYFNQSAHTMNIIHKDVDALTLLKECLEIE